MFIHVLLDIKEKSAYIVHKLIRLCKARLAEGHRGQP
jgi:hypothetical protein